jgi:hypothetical protein
MQSKKHGVREIVVSALRGQPGNTNFERMSRYKNGIFCVNMMFINNGVSASK